MRESGSGQYARRFLCQPQFHRTAPLRHLPIRTKLKTVTAEKSSAVQYVCQTLPERMSFTKQESRYQQLADTYWYAFPSPLRGRSPRPASSACQQRRSYRLLDLSSSTRLVLLPVLFL